MSRFSNLSTISKSQFARLIRKDWKGIYGPKQLSEELYAIFQGGMPFVINGPLVVDNPTDAPGITIIQNGDNTVGFDLGEATGGISGGGGGGATAFPGQVVSGAAADYQVRLYPDGPSGDPGEAVAVIQLTVQDPDVPIEADTWVTVFQLSDGSYFMNHLPPAPGVWAGRVASGSGQTYQVALYANGPDQVSTETVEVRQLQIDPNDTIPEGTWVLVGRTQTGSYYMQVAVWL